MLKACGLLPTGFSALSGSDPGWLRPRQIVTYGGMKLSNMKIGSISPAMKYSTKIIE